MLVTEALKLSSILQVATQGDYVINRSELIYQLSSMPLHPEAESDSLRRPLFLWVGPSSLTWDEERLTLWFCSTGRPCSIANMWLTRVAEKFTPMLLYPK